MSGDELSEEELVDLRRLQVRFQNTFSRNDGDLGRTDMIQHRIKHRILTPAFTYGKTPVTNWEERNGTSRSAENARKRDN